MVLNQEESLFSGIKIGGKGFFMEAFVNKSLNEFDNSCNLNCETENSYSYSSREGKTEKMMSEDIVDLLPKDPFGMDINATVTAFTEWFEDFGLKNLGFESGSDDEDENVDGQLLAEVNIVWNSVTGIHTDVSNMKSDTRFTDSSIEFNGLYDGPLLVDGDIEEIMSFSFEKYWTPPNTANKYQGCRKNNNDSVPGPPPDALFFALGCLGVTDLLSVERVCKPLRDAVQSDPLLWKNIHIDCALSYKIIDDDLLRLTKRAQGGLHSLSLAECLKITDNGLKRVLKSNPGLTKLNVAGCLRLSIEGILSNLRFLRSLGRPGIKYLRIGDFFDVSSRHFQELKLLLGAQNQKQQQGTHKPRFFRAEQLYLSFDDDRDIDLEICPRCQQIRQVYDCPADSCTGKLQTPQACRACTCCISRCISCGWCLSNCDYEVTFSHDLICLDCWTRLLSCQEGQRMAILPKQTYLNQQARYHFFLCG